MIVIQYILVGVALLIASYTDLKTREVPDWLNYSLIASGVSIGLFASVFYTSWHILASTFAGLLVGIGLGFIMYYAGQWGGGDAKLIMGVGAVFGLQLFTSFSIFNLPLFILFIINLVLAGAVYGLVWAFVMILRHWKKVSAELDVTLKKSHLRKLRIIILVVVVVSLVSALTVTTPVLRLLFSALALMTFFLFYMWHISKALEKVCMIKKIPLSKVTEGDWVAEEIRCAGKLLAGPKDLGITKEQIAALHKANITTVVVKEGIPFVPSFFLAYVLTLVLGNWFMVLL